MAEAINSAKEYKKKPFHVLPLKKISCRYLSHFLKKLQALDKENGTVHVHMKLSQSKHIIHLSCSVFSQSQERIFGGKQLFDDVPI